MVEDAYFLMDEGREELIQVVTATQVANAKLYNKIRSENALWAKYMMDEFKKFLNNDNITTLERQSLLMKFLMEQTNYDIVHEVMQYLDGCDLKKDYSVIVMEWTLHNSQDIMEQVLENCDGADLIKPIYKGKKEKLVLPQIKEDDVQAVVEIKVLSLEDQKKQLTSLPTDNLNMLISQILDEEGIDNVDGTAAESEPEDPSENEGEDDK